MKIEMDRKELEAVLLNWAKAKFGPEFNTIEWGGYNSPSAVEFSQTKERDLAPKPRAAAPDEQPL